MRTTFHYPESLCGRTYADVITKISRMDSLPNYLSYGAPLARASRARSSAINIFKQIRTILHDILRTCEYYNLRWTLRLFYVVFFFSFHWSLCISQLQLHPTPHPPPSHSGLIPGHKHFFLPWMANSRGWGLLSCQIPRGGDEKRGQMPCPQSTPQHFSLIAQSSTAILSILMCDYLFQSTSSFVIVLF